MAVVTASPTRALRRPLRLDVRALVGILLMLVATGGSIAVWTAEQDTRSVLVLARDLPAGATLSQGDVTVSRARLDDPVYEATVPASQLNSIVGRQLAEPVHANQLLGRASISTRPRLEPGAMVMAIPVRTDAAAGGRIRAGDAVQVFGTNSKQDGSTRVVLQRAIVYDVGREQSSSFNTSTGSQTTTLGAVTWITLIVNQDEATRLAQARWTSDMDVTLLAPQPAQ